MLRWVQYGVVLSGYRRKYIGDYNLHRNRVRRRYAWCDLLVGGIHPVGHRFGALFSPNQEKVTGVRKSSCSEEPVSVVVVSVSWRWWIGTGHRHRGKKLHEVLKLEKMWKPYEAPMHRNMWSLNMK